MRTLGEELFIGVRTGIVLGVMYRIIMALIAPAHGEDAPGEGGLTVIQKRQIADPNNPQFEPPMKYRAAPADTTVYITPRIPSEEEKVSALKLGYEMNGKSMVGATIDLMMVPRPIKVMSIMPTKVVQAGEPPDLNMEDLRKFSRRANFKTDICARYHMHKVLTNGGKSWRCK